MDLKELVKDHCKDKSTGIILQQGRESQTRQGYLYRSKRTESFRLIKYSIATRTLPSLRACAPEKTESPGPLKTRGSLLAVSFKQSFLSIKMSAPSIRAPRLRSYLHGQPWHPKYLQVPETFPGNGSSALHAADNCEPSP